MGMQFGDTTMSKVFVGGLAWETQRDELREHFDKYGEILEAVIISDKATGRSKGYGFVTFKEPDSAKKACEDPTPVINGRRANCNIASLGARRTPRASPPTTPTLAIVPPRQPAGPRAPSAQWYCAPPIRVPPPPPPAAAALHHYPGVVPYYAAAAAYGTRDTRQVFECQVLMMDDRLCSVGSLRLGTCQCADGHVQKFSPYNMTDLGYNAKISHSNGVGSYVQGQYYTTQGGMVSPNAMVPMYPMYPYHHHRSQNMAHFFPATIPTSAAIAAVPTVVSKPAAAMPSATVCMAVEQMTGCS